MNCPKCGKEVGTSRFCPDCGADMSGGSNYGATPRKKKKKGWVVLAFVIVILVAVIVGTTGDKDHLSSASNGSASQNGSNGQDQQTAQDLEILDYTSTSDNYLRYATGHIKNNTDKTYSYVQVEINLYSGETLVGSTLDNVTNLAPGDVWEFKAVIAEENADSFRIVDVTGW